MNIDAMLTSNISLIELNISSNEMIGEDGVITIAEALFHNLPLTKLILNLIPFGDAGARSIATLLTTNIALKEIHLQGCSIGDAGAIIITYALKTNTSLRELDLSGNPFSCIFITNHLIPMLAVNETLELLQLGNHIEPMDVIVLGVLLQTIEEHNDTVKVAVHDPCDFDDDDFDEASNESSPTELELLLDKIAIIGSQNLRGIRKQKRRRLNIFNDLKVTWINKNT